MTTARWTKFTAALLAAGLWASVAQAEAPLKLPINAILTPVRDANGVRPNASTDPATPLFTAALGNPLLAPDGHQLTWGEWMRPATVNKSEARIRCDETGTDVHFKFRGLIPNALYSAWLFVEETDSSPILAGRFPTNSLLNNAFRTDDEGSAEFHVTSPPGPLTVTGGEFTGCVFDYVLFSLNMTYHSDGHLYGDVPGPPAIVLQQFNFAFAP